MAADLVIKGGTVMDGTGQPGYAADVAVSDGRIVEIGPNLGGRRELDASGLAVAPGFIDIHTHYDAQVFFDPGLTPSTYHGVTTVVAGNCGFSIAPVRPDLRELLAHTLENVEDMDYDVLLAGVPWNFETFPDYLAAVGESGCVANFTAYVGHTAVRLFVMGPDAYERAASEDEIEAMAAVVGQAMEAGAAGFSTSFAPPHNGAYGKPVPSRLAEMAEFERLLAVMKDYNRGVVAVAPGATVGIDALYDLQRRTGVPFTYGALLTNPSGSHLRLLDLNDQGWKDGAQVWPQVTPRPLAFSFSLDEPYLLNVNPLFAALAQSGIEDRRERYRDPAWRAEAWRAFDGLTMKPRWDTYVIAESRARPDLEGARVSDLATSRGITALDVILDAASAEDDLRLRVQCVIANDDPDGVARLLSDDKCTLGLSDAGAHVGQLCDAPQATDFLGTWVRDRQLMPLETAVRKLTGVQADLFGFPDRGYLRAGAWADITVFDPQTIAPGPIRRIADFPGGSERLTADAPVGVTHVLVNGVAIQTDGVPDDAGRDSRPGQLVRPGRRS